MNILSKQIEMSNAIVVLGDRFFVPPAADFMSLFESAALKGSHYVDDPHMRISVFEVPSLKYRYVFENNRIRVEDMGFRYPNESGVAAELHRIVEGLYKNVPVMAYGFNFDAVYKFDNIIPQREILKNFIPEIRQDFVKNFGWQFTLDRERGKKIEAYFVKAVSPLELRMHANFHFPHQAALVLSQFDMAFRKSYEEMDGVIKDFSL